MHKKILYVLCIILLTGMNQQAFGQINYIESSLVPQISTSEITASESTTNLVLTKSIRSVGDKVEVKYAIKTPQVDNYEFILALDSSGSMGQSGDPLKENAIAYAVPKFLNELTKNYPNKTIDISILSWDDDIDFAYGDRFENLNPHNAKLMPIQIAANDIMTYPVFKKNNENNYFFKCLEREGTNISKAIESSLDIFKSNPTEQYNRTSRCILLVIGNSEYEKCSSELLQRAGNMGIPIYAIGLDINERSSLLNHLMDICNNDTTRFQSCISSSVDIQENLLQAFNKFFSKTISEPVARDVSITDFFSNYLLPEKMALFEIVGTGESYRSEITERKLPNGDASVEINIPFGLIPNTITEITLDFDPLLTQLNESVFPNSTKTKISYNWFNGQEYVILLPDNELIFGDNTWSNKAKALRRLLLIM